jgi:aminopeptidase N
MTIAHEVAHQWWAIAVGSDSQRYPFVDESLTNYSALLYFEDRYGKSTAEKMRDLHLKTAYAAGRMLSGRDAPANLAASAYAGDLQYAAVVYGKAALYYDALRRTVGDRIFFDSLREYYRRYSGRIAGPRSLLDIVEAKAPQSGVEALYRRWIEEAHGDEDVGMGNFTGLGDILQQLLQGIGNPQKK